MQEETNKINHKMYWIYYCLHKGRYAPLCQQIHTHTRKQSRKQTYTNAKILLTCIQRPREARGIITCVRIIIYIYNIYTQRYIHIYLNNQSNFIFSLYFTPSSMRGICDLPITNGHNGLCPSTRSMRPCIWSITERHGVSIWSSRTYRKL